MDLIASLSSRIEQKSMLDHPFYRRWNAGNLSIEELQEYARQYYHFTLAFPTFVSGVHSNCEDIATRQALLENLIEEERGPENHPELWLRFCDSLGLDRDDVRESVATESTREVIDVMRALTRDGEVHEGLAALYAYESQVPRVALSKIKGLGEFYDIRDERAISFFSVHAEADVYHAKTSEQLIGDLCDDAQKRDEASAAVDATLAALYTFLDGVNAGASMMVH